MPQYMLSVHHGEASPLPEGVAPEEVFAAVDAFNQRLIADGALVFACGLMPSAGAKVVHADGSVTEGPIGAGAGTPRADAAGNAVGAGVFLGGYWIVEAPDEAAALNLARDAVATRCNQTVEVRALQGE